MPFDSIFNANGGDDHHKSTGIDDERCRINGFNNARTGAQRTQSLVGVLVLFNGQSINQVKRFINANSTDKVYKIISELKANWKLDIDISSGVVRLNDLGPIFNANAAGVLEVAFPTGNVIIGNRLYKVC